MLLREAIFVHSKYEILQHKHNKNACKIFVNKQSLLVQIFTEGQCWKQLSEWYRCIRVGTDELRETNAMNSRYNYVKYM